MASSDVAVASDEQLKRKLICIPIFNIEVDGGTATEAMEDMAKKRWRRRSLARGSMRGGALLIFSNRQGVTARVRGGHYMGESPSFMCPETVVCSGAAMFIFAWHSSCSTTCRSRSFDGKCFGVCLAQR